MPELLKSFDTYNNEVNRFSYFINCYEVLPSSMTFYAKSKEKKEVYERVLATLEIDTYKLLMVFKHWNTVSSKKADGAKNFPRHFLMKSDARKLMIDVTINYSGLTVEFIYDGTDADLEQETLRLHDSFRQQFGTSKTPAFKVLTYASGHFNTEKVKNTFKQADLATHYNDDFLEVNALIEASLTEEKSGLILLHGAPGTGKTSYIKSIISKFRKSSFIFVQNEFVKDLLKPEFISFLLKNRNSILIIEDAEKVIATRESPLENSVVSTILQLTDGLFSDYLNSKIICTFNTTLDKVDKALLRKGRLIVNYEFKPLTADKVNQLLQALGHPATTSHMPLAEIFNYDKKSFDPEANKKKIGF